MTVTILNVKALDAVLGRAAKVAPRKSSLPILQTVKIAVDYVDLVIEATDLEIGYRGYATQASGPDVDFAPVCVDARAFRDAVAACKRTGGSVALESDGARLIIRGGGGETTLDGLPADDYPVIPRAHGDGWEAWDFPTRDLESALALTVFAAATDDSRPVLQYVNAARQSDGRVRFVGVDGFRLAYAFTDAPDGPEFPNGDGLGIHRKAATLFAGIVRRGDGPATLCRFTEGGEVKRMAIQSGAETVLWTPPLFGAFPDVDRVIPRERANVIMAADQFAAAAARAKRAGAVHLAIEVGGTAATLTAGGNDVKQASTCPAEPIGDGCEPLAVALAPRYAAEAAVIGKGGDLYWLIQDKGKPARYDLPDKSAGGVIMPMNVAA